MGVGCLCYAGGAQGGGHRICWGLVVIAEGFWVLGYFRRVNAGPFFYIGGVPLLRDSWGVAATEHCIHTFGRAATPVYFPVDLKELRDWEVIKLSEDNFVVQKEQVCYEIMLAVRFGVILNEDKVCKARESFCEDFEEFFLPGRVV